MPCCGGRCAVLCRPHDHRCSYLQTKRGVNRVQFGPYLGPSGVKAPGSTGRVLQSSSQASACGKSGPSRTRMGLSSIAWLVCKRVGRSPFGIVNDPFLAGLPENVLQMAEGLVWSLHRSFCCMPRHDRCPLPRPVCWISHSVRAARWAIEVLQVRVTSTLHPVVQFLQASLQDTSQQPLIPQSSSLNHVL